MFRRSSQVFNLKCSCGLFDSGLTNQNGFCNVVEVCSGTNCIPTAWLHKALAVKRNVTAKASFILKLGLQIIIIWSPCECRNTMFDFPASSLCSKTNPSSFLHLNQIKTDGLFETGSIQKLKKKQDKLHKPTYYRLWEIAAYPAVHTLYTIQWLDSSD